MKNTYKTKVATTNNEKKMLDTKNERVTNYRKIFLDENILKIEKVISTYKVTRKLDSETNKPINVISKELIKEEKEPMRFYLNEVTETQLYEYRRNGISSFVLKKDGKLYHSEIPRDISFVSSGILGIHRCGASGSECRRLSAASDEEGGCAKVRERSEMIERYPWIVTGYETFNTLRDSFVVVTCEHYEKCPPRKKMTQKEVNNARLALAQFVWEDVRTIDEVKKRKIKLRV